MRRNEDSRGGYSKIARCFDAILTKDKVTVSYICPMNGIYALRSWRLPTAGT